MLCGPQPVIDQAYAAEKCLSLTPAVFAATQFLCKLDSLQTLMRCSECLTAGLTVSNMASTKTLGVRYVVRSCVAFVLYHSCLRYELKLCILRCHLDYREP